MAIVNIKPISISLSPNTQWDDIWLALKLRFQFWRWIRGKETGVLEQRFQDYLGAQHAISFNSGRSALLAILHALQLQPADEVLVQAFTCNAVPNPVLWSGLTPVYVDCREDDFNMDAKDLEQKITSRSRVVMVQHTFGMPANMDSIMDVCRRHNLLLVEDCAHALGAEYKGKKVGTFGQAAFFSFSRDKVISSVYGGMAVTFDDALAKRISQFQETIGYPSAAWTFQQILHPLLMNLVILPTYRIVGKYLLVLFQQLHILSKAVHWREKKGKMPGYFPKRLPNALAIFALHQFGKLEKFNQHRKGLAQYYMASLSHTRYKIRNTKYQEGAIFLRFPVQHPQAHEIIKKAWRSNLLIGDWYTSPIAPNDTQLDALGYRMGSCPVAERLSRITFNLPTHINITKKEADIIINFLHNIKLNDR